jgi:hemerythrin superfamily protein
MISGEEITSTFDLMNEHRELLSLVEEVEKKKEQDLEPLIQELTKLLKAHALLEEESFYPEIDDYLNENDKKELEEKIKEIIKN